MREIRPGDPEAAELEAGEVGPPTPPCRGLSTTAAFAAGGGTTTGAGVAAGAAGAAAGVAVGGAAAVGAAAPSPRARFRERGLLWAGFASRAARYSRYMEAQRAFANRLGREDSSSVTCCGVSRACSSSSDTGVRLRAEGGASESSGISRLVEVNAEASGGEKPGREEEERRTRASITSSKRTSPSCCATWRCMHIRSACRSSDEPLRPTPLVPIGGGSCATSCGRSSIGMSWSASGSKSAHASVK
mmetsp:Transcript_9057/g.20268  ORF Transcript_9057/g.20268 Transcript_9057/m.20268 type:complete len:246 (+) Transcript_9057:581-1318(+)